MKRVYTCMAVLMISVNAFAQWQTVYLTGIPKPLPGLQSVAFTTFNKGMCAGGTMSSNPSHPIIIRSFDNGNTWDTSFVSNDTMIFNKMVFLDSNITIAVGGSGFASGIIVKTTDFGNTWSVQHPSATLNDVCFPTQTTGYAVGNNGTVLKTTDGGISWTSLNTNVNTRFATLSFVDSLTGFVSGNDTILKTTDGGLSWSSSVVGYALYTSQLFFPSSNAGYFEIDSADYYQIYKTTDLGATWNLQGVAAITSLALNSMFFTDDSTGYLAGQFDILKTSDYGVTWNPQSSTGPSSNFWDNLMSVSFLNENVGFAAGHDQFYRTTNAGGIAAVNEVSNSNGLSNSPNPSNGIFSITTNFTGKTQIEIFNSLGQVISTTPGTQHSAPGTQMTIDLSDQPDGIYFVRVSDGKKVCVKKVVKE